MSGAALVGRKSIWTTIAVPTANLIRLALGRSPVSGIDCWLKPRAPLFLGDPVDQSVAFAVLAVRLEPRLNVRDRLL